MLSCVGQTDLGGHGGRAEEIRLVDEGPTIAEINAVALRVAAEAQAKANPLASWSLSLISRDAVLSAMPVGLTTRVLTFRGIFVCTPTSLLMAMAFADTPGSTNPNRKIFEARKRETAALGAGEKLVLGHPLAATIGDSARCMQNLEKVLFTGPKTSDTVTFICD